MSTTHAVDILVASGDNYELADIRRGAGLEDTSTDGLNEVSARAYDNGQSVQELAPVDGGRQAWTYCASAFILATLVWGFGYSYGIFQNYYSTHPPFSDSSTVSIAAVGTTCLAIQNGEGLFISLLQRRYPDYLKPCMWFGLVLGSASLFCSSFATQVWQLLLLQGVLFGIGGGMVYMPAIMLLPEWFSQRRGLAAGIIFAGSGLGGAIFPLIVNALLDEIGFRWTLRIWAIMNFVVTGIAVPGIQPRIPVPKFSPGQPRSRIIPTHTDFVKNPLFWSFALVTVVQALAYSPVELYIATFAAMVSTPLNATIVLSLFNVADATGQVLVGLLADRYPYPWIMFLSALGSGIAAFLLWGFADTLTRVFAFSIIFGGLMGGFSSVWPAVSRECAGRQPEHAGIVFACASLIKGVAAVVGPSIAGLLYEASKSSAFSSTASYGRFGFGNVEVFVGSCAIATSVVSVVVGLMRNIQ